MRTTITTMTGLVCLTCADVSMAATYTSTSRTGRSFGNVLSISTEATVPGVGIIRRESFRVEPSFGLESVTITVDTTSDTGFVNAIAVKPTVVPSLTENRTFDADFVVTLPADFPLPPITKRVEGRFEQRVRYTGFTDAGPMLASSDTAGIKPIGKPPYFLMRNSLTFAPDTFTLNGVYEVIGPTESANTPFSVDYVLHRSSQMISRIKGDENFGDNFEFTPVELHLLYEPVRPIIFGGTIDNMNFSAEVRPVLFIYASAPIIPEPSSLAVGVSGSLTCLAVRRHRRR
ncbi:MAG: hypothetical protein IT424_12655 [Pirellulales bacterium]|nr:hypothetical protein [Pirellulales bacterium]